MLFLIAFLTLVPAAIARAQEQPQSRLLVGIGAGLHSGEFGGMKTNGLAVSVLGSVRMAPFAAIRGDLSYAHNGQQETVCIWNPCAIGSPKEVPALGLSSMIGTFAEKLTRPYLLVGAELLFKSLPSHVEAGVVTVPKLGIGILSNQLMFVEVTGRWKSDWHGWRLRHFVILAGRYW